MGAKTGRGMRGKAGKLDRKEQGLCISRRIFILAIMIPLNDNEAAERALGSFLCQGPL